VPKHEIIHVAGQHVSKKIKKILLDFFKEDEITKLERLGGRVLIAVTAPYSPKGKNEKNKIEINDAFIATLRNLRDKPVDLKEQISNLSISQLRKLGQLAGHPLRTKSTRQELISELITFFHSEGVWRRISQS
jgi:hypothetical protein